MAGKHGQKLTLLRIILNNNNNNKMREWKQTKQPLPVHYYNLFTVAKNTHTIDES